MSSLPIPIPPTPKKEPLSPTRTRHCRPPHYQRTPEHQRNRRTTQLHAPCSAPSVTTPTRRLVPRADVVTGWVEGNRSLAPVRVPSHTSDLASPSSETSYPPRRRVSHLTFNFTQESFFFLRHPVDILLSCQTSQLPLVEDLQFFLRFQVVLWLLVITEVTISILT